MSYDNWKLQTPDEEPGFECLECGSPMEKDTDYCSKDCYKASQL